MVVKQFPKTDAEPLPPHDYEAEEAAIAACMVSAEAMGAIRPLVEPRDFQRERNGFVYHACCALYDSGQPVNQVSVASELARSGQIEQIGVAFLAKVAGDLATAIGCEWYANRVKQCSQARRLIQAASELTKQMYADPQDIGAVVSVHEQRLQEILSERDDSGLKPIADILDRHYQPLVERLKHPRELGGLSTGFARLDRILDGLKPTYLYVLGAPPANYKTQFAAHIARHVAWNGHTVAMFSLEMAEDPLVQRLLFSDANINFGEIRDRGGATTRDFEALEEARIRLYDAPFYLSDRRGLDLPTARRWLQRVARQRPIDLMVFDYLHLLEIDGVEERQRQLKALMDGIAALAHEFNAAALILSQLNRESNKSRVITLQSMYEGESIGHRGDVVMGIIRAPLNDGTDALHPNRLDYYVIKNKQGPSGKLSPGFWVVPETGRITEEDVTR